MNDTALKAIAIAILLGPLLVGSFGPRGAVERGLERVVNGAFRVASGAALLLLLVQLAVVILRSVFSVSLIWLQESALYLFGAIFLLASGALLLNEGHVRVDILYQKFSPRLRRLIDLGGLLLFVIPLGILIIWVSWRYVGTSWAQLERSQEASGIHAVFLLKSMIPAFAVLVILAAEARVLALLRELKSER